MNLETDVRRLRYRLKRQGMLELDAWLSRLDAVLLLHDERITSSVNELLSCEVPELLAMMQGDKAIPDILTPYLTCE